MAGQFDREVNNTDYGTLTPYSTSNIRGVSNNGNGSYSYPTISDGSRPSMNLKSNVVITGGDGTKNSPFRIKLGS